MPLQPVPHLPTPNRSHFAALSPEVEQFTLHPPLCIADRSWSILSIMARD